MTKFTIALREIGTYKEVLRSQVEFSCVHYYGSSLLPRMFLLVTNVSDTDTWFVSFTWLCNTMFYSVILTCT
jgi:hypothetical protein